MIGEDASGLTIKLPKSKGESERYNQLKGMYTKIYTHSDKYIPNSLSKFYQKCARDILGINYELMLQLRTDTYGMKSMGRQQVFKALLDDDRDKCKENETILIQQLEQICYEFLV